MQKLEILKCYDLEMRPKPDDGNHKECKLYPPPPPWYNIY